MEHERTEKEMTDFDCSFYVFRHSFLLKITNSSIPNLSSSDSGEAGYYPR